MHLVNEKIPIALFVYARPFHLRRTLESLRANKVPLLYAYSDGPEKLDVAPLVNEVRSILKGIDWCEVRLVEREQNWGLGQSVMAGVTEVLSKHESCLVFEDDLICVPGTYAYLCNALRHYRHDCRVMSVTGWTHPLITPNDVGCLPYFDGRAECWVWGTWARAWTGMSNMTAQELMLAAENRGLDRNAYGYDLPEMAEVEIKRKIWAVRLLYYHILNRGLCLRPPWSMVEHIGFDKMATNTFSAGGWENPPLKVCPPIPKYWPEPIEHGKCRTLHQKAFPPSSERASGRTWKNVRRALVRGIRGVAARITGRKELLTVSMVQVTKLFLPPIVMLAVRALKSSLIFSQKTEVSLSLQGNYASWNEALVASVGYDADNILHKTIKATRLVKLGEAACERDTVLFDEIQYSWPELAGLLWVAAQEAGRLNVLDVGGGLGSTYFSNRYFLNSLDSLRWNIVEQVKHVEAGQREFQDDRLRFYPSVEACLAETAPNVVLLGGVLQYLEDPYRLLDTLTATPCAWLIINRTPFWKGSEERLCVQHVPAEIYSASYPSWIFSLPRFRAVLNLQWETVALFDNTDSLKAPVPVTYRGLIAVRRNLKCLSATILHP